MYEEPNHKWLYSLTSIPCIAPRKELEVSPGYGSTSVSGSSCRDHTDVWAAIFIAGVFTVFT